MRFNVSRFLVRLRQFWTRKRLVPVLGFTALALFLLNFWAFIDYQFNTKPSSAFALYSGSEFPGQSDTFIFYRDHSFSKDSDLVIWRKHSHSDKHLKRHLEKHSERWQSDHKWHKDKSYKYHFEVKRFEEEAKRFKERAERRHEELEQLIQETERIKKEIDVRSNGDQQELIIKRITTKDGEDANQDVSIIINGVRIEG